MNNSIKFDKRGNLIPYQPIEMELDDFEEVFVSSFNNSKTRRLIFDNYLRFLYRFQDEVFPIFEQWVNGSFVTQKVNPKDLDVLTFLNYDVFEKRGEELIDKFWSFSLENQRIDSYIVKTYPSNHSLFPEFKKQKEYWTHLYSHQRADENDVIHRKGFVKLIFEK